MTGEPLDIERLVRRASEPRMDGDDVKVKGPAVGFDELVPEPDARAVRKARAYAAIRSLVERKHLQQAHVQDFEICDSCWPRENDRS